MYTYRDEKYSIVMHNTQRPKHATGYEDTKHTPLTRLETRPRLCGGPAYYVLVRLDSYKLREQQVGPFPQQPYLVGTYFPAASYNGTIRRPAHQCAHHVAEARRARETSTRGVRVVHSHKVVAEFSVEAVGRQRCAA